MPEEIKEQLKAKSYFDLIRKEEIAKLIQAGFTQKQAEVLLEIIQEKSFSGGIF